MTESRSQPLAHLGRRRFAVPATGFLEATASADGFLLPIAPERVRSCAGAKM
jgi:hypothetical protein